MTSYVQRVFRSLAPVKKEFVIKANEEISVMCPLVFSSYFMQCNRKVGQLYERTCSTRSGKESHSNS